MADNVRKVIFAKGEDVRKLVETDYTFAQRILDIIESFLYNFKEKFGLLDGKEQFEAALLQAQRKYRMALAGRKGALGDEANIFALMESAGYWGEEKLDANGNRYWNIGTGKDIFKGLSGRTKALQKRAYQYFVSQNKRFVKEAIVDGDSLIFVPDLGRKYVYGDHSNDLNTEQYEMKLRLLPSVFDLISHATVSWDAPNVKKDKIKYKKDGLKNYRGKTRIDGCWFEYVVRIGKKDGEKFMYELNLKAADANKDLGSKETSPTLPTASKYSISQPDPTVKNLYSFSSPKTDTAPIGAEDFDVQPKNESNPELEKALSDHDFVKDVDGAVRTLAEYRAEKDAADVKKDAPTDTKLPTDNPDVAAVVNTEGLKRAEDIELQYSQRLKGKNGRHPCGYRPFLTQLLPKYCFLRRLIPN